MKTRAVDSLAPGASATGGDTVLAPLTAAQAEAIVRVIEVAPQIRMRNQFFIWTQSQIQVLLPHRVLVCGAYERQRRQLLFEVFNSVVLPPQALRVLADENGVLLRALAAAWTDAGCRAIVVKLAQLREDAQADAQVLVREAGIECLLVHGVARPQRPDEVESLFLFANLGQSETAARLMLAELMLPSLHAAWRRVTADPARRAAAAPSMPLEPALAGASPPAGQNVTGRERQILGWVRDGKSNREIGLILGISPLTVKNHVQKILRKLGASNRAQAVAQAMSRGLLYREPSPGDRP